MEEENGAGFHGHGHSTFEIGGAVGEGEFAVAGIVADHVGGFQTQFVTAGDNPDAAIFLIAILQRNPD